MISLTESVKWRFKEVNLLVQGHAVHQGWSWYSSPDVWVINPDSRLHPRSEAGPLEPGLHLGRTRAWRYLRLSGGRQGLFLVPECPLPVGGQTAGSWAQLGQEG